MKTLSAFFPLIFFSAATWAIPKDFSPAIKTSAIKESDVSFSYDSADGGVHLSCVHFYANPEAWDWDVWCGKGTGTLRTFRVHFLLRPYKSKVGEKSAFEVLYWVIDRDQATNKAFSSTTQWLQFNTLTQPETLSFSQGIENDYASLTLKYAP